jgi:hypothetical protein
VRGAAALLVALAVPAAAAPTPPTTASVDTLHDSPSLRLARGRQAYAHNDWAACASELEPTLYPTVQLSSDDELKARRILALCYLLGGVAAKAEQEFNTLLQLDETFRLDERTDPARALIFLEELKRKNQKAIEEQREAKRREEQQRQREAERKRKEEQDRWRAAEEAKLREKYKPVERHYFALNFVPLGAGQFQNGDRKKAWLFLSTQIAFGAASLAMWGYLLIKYQNGNLRVPNDQLQTANAISNATIGMGALFWADVVVGIVDALIHYQSGMVPVAAPAAPSAPKPKVIAAPFAAPGGGGLSVQGAF